MVRIIQIRQVCKRHNAHNDRKEEITPYPWGNKQAFTRNWLQAQATPVPSTKTSAAKTLRNNNKN